MNAETRRKIHTYLKWFWFSNLFWVWFLPPAWRIPYLIVVSIYANFVGHWSGESAETPVRLEDSEQDQN